MLKRVSQRRPRTSRAGLRVALVASEYNRRHVDSLLAGARSVLGEAALEVIRVPGAFEIPWAAERLAADAQAGWGAIVCLGVIIRGETAHADLVGGAVTRALMEVSLRHGVPVIHEVLLVANQAQADARCLDPRHNRGVEAARTALAMARLRTRWPGGAASGNSPQKRPF
jgi:6,7-dimethyl-8-ribityllumazine synthase